MSVVVGVMLGGCESGGGYEHYELPELLPDLVYMCACAMYLPQENMSMHLTTGSPFIHLCYHLRFIPASLDSEVKTTPLDHRMLSMARVLLSWPFDILSCLESTRRVARSLEFGYP